MTAFPLVARLRSVLACAALALLAACGGGGGGGEPTDPGPVDPPPSGAQGAVVKGPVQGAQVQLFALDDAGFASGPALATLTTDAQGRFEFDRPDDAPALLAVTRGGSFVDESDPQADPALKRRISLSASQGFESVLPAGSDTLVITPYTNALLLRARRAAGGANFLPFHGAVLQQAATAFGFDPSAVIPEPPLAPAASAPAAAKAYAMLLGGAAYAIQAQSVGLGSVPDYASTFGFIEDFSDGRLDGLVAGQPVLVNGVPLPASVRINDEVLRFRNNNFDAYQGVGLASIDENLLSAALPIGNQPPRADADSYAATEDTALAVAAATGVLANDIDSEHAVLAASVVTPPAHGTLALAADGGFTYTPAADYNGADSFSYRAGDGETQSAPATVSLTVAAVNDAPVALDDAFTVAEGATATQLAGGVASVRANDSDVEGSVLTVSLVAGPAHGALTLAADGTFSYVHDGSEAAADSFSYRVSDGALNSGTATVAITITPVNDAPVAAGNSYTTAEDTALTVPAPGVLGNDSDAEGDTLTAVLVTAPSKGSLALAPNGSLVYTPAANANGADSFSYRASDGAAQSNVATVSITVTAANDAPVAAADAYATDEDTTLDVAAPGVLANDSDADSASIGAVLVAQPAKGSLTLNSNGSFRYVPSADSNGTDSFSYRASDGSANSAPVTVALTVRAVNDLPVAANDAYAATEDTALTVTVASGVLANDSDADGTALSATVAAGPAHGTLALNPDGSFVYTPAANYNGSDSFTYRAGDGTAQSNTATVSLTVSAVNDAPTAAADAFTTAEDSALTVSASGVLGNDSDPDGNTLTAVPIAGPAHGTLTLNANGGFVYTPAAHYNGPDSFSYRASDGSLQSATTTVALTVTAVNDIPAARGDSYATNEDTALNVAAASGVLANDSDADGQTLSAVLAAGPAHGTLTLNPNGSFAYTPAADYNGSDSFTYRASDGTVQSAIVTVALTVNAVNDAPVAVADAITVAEGASTTQLVGGAGSVAANDTDAEGSPLSVTLVAAPTRGSLTLNANGSFSYTHNGSETTSDSFSYRVSDGVLNSNTATVSISVTPVNDAPVAAADSGVATEDTALNVAAPGVLGNDSDAENSTLTALVTAAPAHGTVTLNSNGSYRYTPAANYTGPDSFSYKAHDGALDSAAATVSLTVNAVNDRPVAGNDSYSTAEDTVLNVATPGVLGNDTDADAGTTLSATLVTPPANGNLVLNPNGSFSYTPAADFNGSVSFTYTAGDGVAQSAPATVTIAIGAVNDAPVALDDSASTPEDTLLTVAAPGVLANDSDQEGSSLSAVLVAAPASGTLTLNSNGSYSYQPASEFNGTVSFTYSARDGSLDSVPATVTISVGPENDAPVAQDDTVSVAEGGTATLLANGDDSVLDNDADADADTLTALLVEGPAHGALTLNADGSFRYIHDGSQTLGDSFTYQARDASDASNVATVSISIAAVNDAPTAAADSYSTAEDTALNVPVASGVLANDSDADGDALSAVLVSGPASGTLSLSPNGSFLYTPAGNFNGSVSFSYRASDAAATSNLATVTITVSPVNDAPLAVANSYALDEDATLDVTAPGVLGNDSDVDGDTLTAVLGTGPTRGSLTLNPNGSFRYTPDADFSGSDSFTYAARDGSLNSASVTVSLSIANTNDAPVAVDDTASTEEDSLLTITAANLAANDTDADGDGLAVTAVGAAVNGSVSLASGSISFTPAANFSGTASFSYTVSDGSATDTGTVAVTVTPVNDAPVAVADSYAPVAEDGSLTVPAASGVLANDSDLEDSTLTAQLGTSVAHGTLQLNGDGSFVYTPAANYNGSDSFSYRASDGTATSNLITVPLSVSAVNDAPAAGNDSYAVDEDTALNQPAPGVLVNDTDIDGDPLGAAVVANPAKGSLALAADGSFVYTPDADATGADSFTYRVSDGTANSNTATVALTIGGSNDTPVAANDAYTTSEDSPLNVAAGAGVLLNDSDADSDPLTATLVSGPAHGSLTLNADGSFSYTPEPDYAGSDSFSYQASDGTLLSNVATVNLQIDPVDDPAVATDDSAATDEDVTLVVADTTLLANDSDVDGGTAVITGVGNALNGSVSHASGNVSFVPAADFNGAASFTYTITGGSTATVQVTVNPVNDAPVLERNLGGTVSEGGSLLIDDALLSSGDIDSAPAALVYSFSNPSWGYITVNSVPPSGNSFTQAELELGLVRYVSTSGDSSTDSFEFSVSDGELLAAGGPFTFALSIVLANDPPAISLPSGPLPTRLLGSTALNGISISDSDAAAGTLTLDLSTTGGTLTLATDVSGGVTASDISGNASDAVSVTATLDALNTTLGTDGGLVYTDTAGRSGSASVELLVSDNGNTGGTAETDAQSYPLQLSRFSLQDIDGSSGFALSGTAVIEQTGTVVRGIGDFNGDGIPDFAIAAPTADTTAGGDSAGRVYVVFGRSGGFPASSSLAALDETTGLRIDGAQAGGLFGSSVDGAGDFNGDGLADLLVGAPEFDGPDQPDRGAAYLVYGRSTATPGGAIDAVGSAGSVLELHGENSFDNAGQSVAGVGDFNGDGYDDLLVGAPNGTSPTGLSQAGMSYLIFGTDQLGIRGSSVSLSFGVELSGATAGEHSGRSVAAAGDVNGDGLDDLVIAAPDAVPSPASNPGGAAYVVYGTRASDLGEVGAVGLGALDGSSGFVIAGDAAIGSVYHVSAGGDFDGDAYSDLLVGTANDTTAGAGYAVFGGSDVPASVDLAVQDGSALRFDGFAIIDYLGSMVAPAGDVDGDGYDDLLFGAPETEVDGAAAAGSSYLLFGTGDVLPATLDLSAIDGLRGLRFDGKAGADAAGFSVDGAGDLNGDGFGDLLIGAYAVDGGGITGSGESYVVYGRDYRGQLDAYSQADGGLLTGSSGRDLLLGGRNAQSIDGFGGGDSIGGGGGDDVIGFADDVLRIDGGAGEDRLQLPAGAVDLSSYNQSTGANYQRLRSIGRINLGDAGSPTTLTLDFDDVRKLVGADHTLIVNGDTGDALISPSPWQPQAETLVDEGGTYYQYRIGPVRLYVNENVDRSGIAYALDARRASVDSGETDADGPSRRSEISGNGRYVVFESSASDLVFDPVNAAGLSQVFRRDLLNNQTVMLSQGGISAVTAGDGNSSRACTDYTGQRSAFFTAAGNLSADGTIPQLVIATVNVDGLVELSNPLRDVTASLKNCAFSGDGRYLVFFGTPPRSVIEGPYRYDFLSGQLQALGTLPSGESLCAGECRGLDISGDGRYVVYSSDSGALDANGLPDVFLEDTQTGVIRLISSASIDGSGEPSISDDGQRIAFETAAPYSAGDDNDSVDLYVYDVGQDLFTRANVDATGGQALPTGIAPLQYDDGIGAPQLSGDGRYLVFSSDQQGIEASGSTDFTVFVKHLPDLLQPGDSPGAVLRINRNLAAEPYGSDTGLGGVHPSIAFDGSVLAFDSEAFNIVADDANGLADVFTLGSPLYQPSTLDTDGDGIGDADEIATGGTNPGAGDSDFDGLTDGDEAGMGSDPLNADGDGDDVGDGIEVAVGSSPTAADRVIYVSSNRGVDTAGFGGSWDTPYASNGPVASELFNGGSPGAPVYVLYEDGSYDRLTLDTGDGSAQSNVVLIGSMAPGRYQPLSPVTSAFNGNSDGRALTVSGYADVWVLNLALQSGSASTGGGVYASQAFGNPCGLLIRHSVIAFNSASAGGGGLHAADSCDVAVEDSVVEQNSVASENPDLAIATGGGLLVDGGATLSLRNTRVAQNSVYHLNLSAAGGGAAATGGGQLRVSGSVFAFNSAGSGSGSDVGGAVYADSAGLDLRDSTFVSNYADLDGGALWLRDPEGGAGLFNNLFVGNAVLAPGRGLAGAVAIGGSVGGASVIANSIAYNQSFTTTEGVGAGIHFADLPEADAFRNNTVWFNNNDPSVADPGDGDNAVIGLVDGSGGDVVSINNVAEGSSLPGDNVASDPLFVSGFYLDQSASPNIDKGDDLATAYKLVAPYTTAEDGSGDVNAVDIGFHHQAPAPAGVGQLVNLSPLDGSPLCGSATVVLRPLDGDGEAVGPGHLVTARLGGGSVGASMTSLLQLDPYGDGSRLLTDLGDGRYQLDIGVDSDGRVELEVRVDGRDVQTLVYPQECL